MPIRLCNSPLSFVILFLVILLSWHNINNIPNMHCHMELKKKKHEEKKNMTEPDTFSLVDERVSFELLTSVYHSYSSDHVAVLWKCHFLFF